MRSLFIITLLFMTSGLKSYAQDTLFYHDGTKEVVKVIAYRGDFVKYHSIDTTVKSTFYKSNAKVNYIVFEKGSKFGERYDLNAPVIESDETENIPYSHRYLTNFNRVGVDVFDALWLNATVYYQHTFPNYLTISIPFSFSPGAVFGKNYQNLDISNTNFTSYRYYSKFKLFSTGVDLMSYPKGFVYGGSLEFGMTKNYFVDNYYDSLGTHTYTDASNSPFGSLFVRLGYDNEFSEHVGFCIYGDLGVTRYRYEYAFYDPNIQGFQINSFNSTAFSARFKVRIYYSF